MNGPFVGHSPNVLKKYRYTFVTILSYFYDNQKHTAQSCSKSAPRHKNKK